MERERPTYWGWDWPPAGAVVMPPAPDLQALVEKHGGYHCIPRDAWAEHFNKMIDVQVWLTMRHFPPKSCIYSGVKLKPYIRPRHKRDRF
jgi:hypothetical protein